MIYEAPEKGLCFCECGGIFVWIFFKEIKSVNLWG